jgi:hypothetical protein
MFPIGEWRQVVRGGNGFQELQPIRSLNGKDRGRRRPRSFPAVLAIQTAVLAFNTSTISVGRRQGATEMRGRELGLRPTTLLRHPPEWLRTGRVAATLEPCVRLAYCSPASLRSESRLRFRQLIVARLPIQ